MKSSLFLLFFLLIACSNNKTVFWCGDHACINKKEKESYFKKTMIVEIKEIDEIKESEKSELEKITKRAILDEKKRIKNEKELAKQERHKEKRRVKEEKELLKQARLENKRQIKEEKKFLKQSRLEEKKRNKDKKKVLKQASLDEKNVIKKNTATTKKIIPIKAYSSEFHELVEKISKKNMFRSYPNINDIPN